MHNYISKNEVFDLIHNKRKALVIREIKAADISEYLNNLLIFLKSNGVDINIFNIPKVKRISSSTKSNNNKKILNEYVVILVVRNNVKIMVNELYAIRNIISTINKCDILGENNSELIFA